MMRQFVQITLLTGTLLMGLVPLAMAQTWPKQTLLVNPSRDHRSPELFTAICYSNNLCSKKYGESPKRGASHWGTGQRLREEQDTRKPA